MSKITVYQRGSDIKVLGGIIGSDVWSSVQEELLSDILMNIELFNYGIDTSHVGEMLKKLNTFHGWKSSDFIPG